MEHPSGSQSINVLVVDDHSIVRDGVAALLERNPRLKVVGQASDGRQAVEAAEHLEPDIVVMDLVLPELSGFDATERILASCPQTRVVILSACHTSEHVFRALRAGAWAYVLKDAAVTELTQAVIAAIGGRRYFSPLITELLVNNVLTTSDTQSPLERLSAREREVLHLTVAGSTSAEIAQKLSLSRKTVDTYRSRIMEKLGVANLAGLIRFASEHALTPA